jgi:hypothetical protein
MRSFAEIETWIAANAAPLRLLLNPPATEATIRAFESRHGVVFPPDVRSFYLTHDGESPESDGILGFMRLLPLAEIEDAAAAIAEGGLTRVIPILESGGGDRHYVQSYDAANPDPKLYDWWHERPAQADVIADSLEAFFADFLAKLHQGQYVYEPEEAPGGLINKDEL